MADLTQIPKFGIVLVVVLVLGALGFRDRKETDVLQLICSVSLIAKRSGFSRTRTTTRTTPQIRNLGLNDSDQALAFAETKPTIINQSDGCAAHRASGWPGKRAAFEDILNRFEFSPRATLLLRY